MSNLVTQSTIDKFKGGVNGLLEKYGLTVSPETGIVFGEDVRQEDVIDAAQRMMTVSEVNTAQRTLIDQYLGQLIVGYSAMANISWSEAISCMNLVTDTGRGFKSLIKLPRMVSLLPEDVFTLPLTSGHLDAATSFAGPKNPSQAGEFNERRVKILREAAKSPIERNKAWVFDEMRKLQHYYGVTPSRKVPVNDIRKAFEICSQALVEWTDEDYAAFDTTRGQLLDRWRGYRDELIEREVLSDDSSNPETFTLPWRQDNDKKPAIEAEILYPEEELQPEEAASAI